MTDRRNTWAGILSSIAWVVGVGCAAMPEPRPMAESGDSDPVQVERENDAPTATAIMDDEQPLFRARVVIDAEPGSKQFQGVWLEAESGERYLIDYRAQEWLRALEGRRVDVWGAVYEPSGQAIMATHFRVALLRVAEPTMEDWIIEIGARTRLRGSFTRYVWPAGTKLAGEGSTVFMDEGGVQHWLASVPEPGPPLDQPVVIDVVPVEPSNFVARPGGRAYLWVIEIEAEADPG